MVKNGIGRLGSSITLERGYFRRSLVFAAFYGTFPGMEEALLSRLYVSATIQKDRQTSQCDTNSMAKSSESCLTNLDYSTT
ncbi:hypothetical protein EYC84_000264 [Monilinia fructicola]|uniref:Uncharacterized protein n=1 Tax=Monilinia fructicola TaxID=38448 RepID=A0A5M9JVM3_MONFR|nr:hypothetical protein EYC84_000264 [Monilinia fructicola]